MQMVEAESRGRLFGLAGDVLQWSGRPTYSLRAAADALGVAVDDVARAWAVLGLTVADLDPLALSGADVDALATWVGIREAVGDEVMWVSSTPETLVKAAVDLVEHPKAREAGLRVRAGLGYGEVLAINGDYFGNAVNLAAQLVAAAAPRQILAAPAVYDALPQWPAIVQDPLTLKGFDTPVTPYDLRTGR